LPNEKESGLPSHQPLSSNFADSTDVRQEKSTSTRRWVGVALIFTAVLYLLYGGGKYCSGKPLSPDFVGHCNSLLESPIGTYTDRISRLTTALESDTIYVAEPGTSSEYFIGGFSSRDWWLSERPLLIALTPSNPNITIITARFEQGRAELVHLPKEIRDITTFVPWLESESPYEILRAHLESAHRVVVDGQVRSFIAQGLEAAGFAKGTREEGDRIKELRERKDEREIGLLRCANQVCSRTSKRAMLTDQMTLHAIRKTREKMHFGITEARTRMILEKEMAKTGLVAGDGLVLFGGTSPKSRYY